MKFKIEGISPLLMHNEQLADPLNAFAQQVAEISSKRKKTRKITMTPRSSSPPWRTRNVGSSARKRSHGSKSV